MSRARVEIATRQSHDIYRSLQPPKTPMNTPVPVEGIRRVVRQHNAEIQIAVRPGFPPRFRAKEVDANRPIELHQPPGNLVDGLLLGHDPIRLSFQSPLPSFTILDGHRNQG